MKQATQQALNEATDSYYQQVGQIADYLLERGITGEMAQQFRLGFVAEPMPGHEQFTGRLAIPYLTRSGNTAWFKFRDVANDGGPKYLGLPGGSTRLFNARVVPDVTDVLAVCEGELDAIVLQGTLGVPAVGVPGVNNFKPHFRRVFDGVPRLLAVGDGDEPGQEFSRFLARELEATIVDMPTGHDVTSLLLEQGVNALREKVLGG